ncbi:MFS transporter [Paenibacillus sp. FSL R7-0331]|uniref:MFS transporter n=1 Tax=Paenibacillus sp. FSL R7-0331 TaxID=1536773 RepID=UPI000B154FEB|nr:MFS transporter [Paenibacillus sp. FSL R7-0331]
MNKLIRNKVFLIVATADLLQQTGIWIRNMALLFYIMDQTGNNPTAVSMLTALEYLPIFVFSLIGGTFADRWNPKKTVILGDRQPVFPAVLRGAVQKAYPCRGGWNSRRD